MKLLIIISFYSIFTFSQNLRSPEEVKAFNKEFIRLINIERKKLNIDILIESEELNNKSMSWSRECVTFSKFEHSKLTNASAECLTSCSGKGKHTLFILKAINSFKLSEPHWKILMDPSYKYIGLGEYYNRLADSTLTSVVTVQLK
jgi:uncharacterized protein YkwD